MASQQHLAKRRRFVDAVRSRLRALTGTRGEADPIIVIVSMIILMLCATGISSFYATSMLRSGVATANTAVTSALQQRLGEFQRTPWGDLAEKAPSDVSIVHGANTYEAYEQVTYDPTNLAYRLDITAPRRAVGGDPAVCGTPALTAIVSGCLTLTATVSATSEDVVPPTPEGVVVNPGLGANPVVNLVANASFEEAGASTMVVRKNYALNPGARGTTGGDQEFWAATNGARTFAWVDADWSASGKARRITITTQGTASSVVSQVTNLNSASRALTAGRWTIQQRVHVEDGVVPRSIAFTEAGSGNTIVANGNVDLGNNVWLRWATVNLTTVGADWTGNPRLDWSYTPALPAVGTVFELSMTDIYAGDYDPARVWFDGSTAAAGDYSYAWTIAANAGPSVQTAPVPVNVNASDGSGAAKWRSSAVSYSDEYSLAVLRTAAASSWATTPPIVSGAVAAGSAYTAVVACIVPTGSPAGATLGVQEAGGAYRNLGTALSSIGSDWTVGRVSFTAPADLNAAGIRFTIRPPDSYSAVMYCDLLTLVRDAALDTVERTNYALNPDHTVAWQLNASATGASSTLDTAYVRPGKSTSVKLTAGTGYTYASVAGRTSLQLAAGESAQVGVWVYREATGPDRIRVVRRPYATVRTVTLQVGWNWVTGGWSGVDAYADIGWELADGFAGKSVWLSESMLTVGDTPLASSDFFSGSSVATSTTAYRWTGVSNGSPSQKLARVYNAYTGPPFSGSGAAIATFHASLLEPGTKAYRASFRWAGDGPAPSSLVAIMSCANARTGETLSTTPMAIASGNANSQWLWARIAIPDTSRLRDCDTTVLSIIDSDTGLAPAATSFEDLSVLGVLAGVTPPGGQS